MLTKTLIAPKIWAVYSDTQPEAGRAFVRFQEYYENPDLKGKKDLTIRDVEAWWERTKQEDEKDYYDHWTGFNLPGRIFVELLTSPAFRAGFSVIDFFTDPLNYPRWYGEEDDLLALITDIPVDQIVQSYFIGLSKDSTDVLNHEVAHGLFALNPTYRAEQTYNLSQLPKEIYDRIHDDLISGGYHRDVIHDEIQAYLSTYTDDLANKFETLAFDKHTSAFEKTFSKFYC